MAGFVRPHAQHIRQHRHGLDGQPPDQQRRGQGESAVDQFMIGFLPERTPFLIAHGGLDDRHTCR